jgi:hypothetical protein
MNKLLSVLFFVPFTLAAYGQSFYGSQYVVGSPLNDSIASTPISDPGPGGCYPSASYTVTFPMSKVTGVKYYMLITAVSPGNSAYTTQLGQLHVGDTLPFISAYPSYDFYFPTGGGIMYIIKAIGTPTKEGEYYSCGEFVENTNSAGCPDVISYNFVQSAKVQDPKNSSSQVPMRIMPLVTLSAASFSSTNTVNIDPSIKIKDARFELYDAFGRRVQSTVISDKTFTITREDIPNGNYIWKVINDRETIGLGKVIITQ